MPLPIVPFSECREISLRETLIKLLDKADYSFKSYPQFNDLELAVRTEILSFGIDLRPGWEKILRTACTITGMGCIKHPIEIQFSIAVCNLSTSSYGVDDTS
jgi:hypothetical protein